VRRRRPIGTPAGAETAAVRVVRRIYREVWRRILATVEETWPNTTEADLRAAIVGALDRRSTVLALRRVGVTVRRSVHRALEERDIPTLPRWRGPEEEAAADFDATGLYAAIVVRLLGAVVDAAKSKPVGPPTPVLNRVMARLRAKRATNEEIAKVLSDLRATAPAEERAAISRVRARVVKWGAEANRRKQVDAGIKRYTWITKRDDRVRPMHFMLDRTVQRWSKPPIIRSDGTRGHPGDDYNCRCSAEPVVNRESKRIAARRARAAREEEEE